MAVRFCGVSMIEGLPTRTRRTYLPAWALTGTEFTIEALKRAGHNQGLAADRCPANAPSLHPTIHPGGPAQRAGDHPGAGLPPAHAVGAYGFALAYGAESRRASPRPPRQRRELSKIRGDAADPAPGRW